MSLPLVVLEKFIAYSFILCAGISSTLTRSNAKRGLIVLAAGGIVTAVSYVVEMPIKFGVLQFLGLAMLFYSAAGRWTRRIPEKLAPVLWIVLFAVFHVLTDRIIVSVKWLFWLGFCYDGYVSYDHFPVLPYLFLFLLGTWIGEYAKKRQNDLPLLRKPMPRWLTVPGHHTLWIYLVHQPVLYGACWLINMIM